MHLWDMRMIEMMREGKSQQIINEMPEFCEQAIAETDGGALTWLLSAMGLQVSPQSYTATVRLLEQEMQSWNGHVETGVLE